MSKPLSGEKPGTVLLGSIDKGAYLFLCQSSARMRLERDTARASGIQDPIDFVFEFDGVRYELRYEALRALLGQYDDIDRLKRRIGELERQVDTKLVKSSSDPTTGDKP
jgi:hypothetical protein